MLDSQQVELIGRNLLVAQLLADGVEVAAPQRDRGIDLIAYLDTDDARGFVARPIQLKAASAASFVVDRKYERFPSLLLAYVWGVARPLESRTYCLEQHQAVQVADQMGWTTTASWRRGAYSTSKPSQELVALLQPFLMQPGDWTDRLFRSWQSPSVVQPPDS